jgi:hypothetical protein
VPAPALTTVALGTDPAESLRAVPASGGVGQILGPDGRNLLIGKAANLRRWAGTYFGLGPPPKPGVRPRTNLTGLAVAVAFAETASDFGQRLRYERLMARYVPLDKRKDLKPPSWVALDPAERFPRVLVRDDASSGPLYGPFRDRAAAVRARDLLYKRFGLRPCDYVFEPDPALPLGLGCLYAQVRTCAAPCLARVGEDAYRGLAREAARFLAEPDARGDALPGWIRPLAGQRALGLGALRAPRVARRRRRARRRPVAGRGARGARLGRAGASGRPRVGGRLAARSEAQGRLARPACRGSPARRAGRFRGVIT